MAPFKQTALVILLGAAYAHLAAQTVAPAQLPTGGKVVAGQAALQQSGSVLNVNQSSQRAAIDWSTFNVGKEAQVNFNQPSANAVSLNRVLDTNASQIMGRIQATGQVFLSNPNGVLFGPQSQVDVGGLVATTQQIGVADFMAGKSTFEGDGRSGVSVVNQGQLQAALGGYIALLAPTVRNEGIVLAREGAVALAAGDKTVIEFSGARMVSVLVDRAVMDALVDNRQVVRADGGWVVLSARSANAILSSVITQSGTVQANTVVNRNGRILLEGGEQGVVQVSGSLQASGQEAGSQGGNIVVTGDKVQIATGAQLDATGRTGGGSVLVGGGWQGQDPSIRQANAVVVEAGTRLDASAIDQGQGGTVVAWSNTQNKNGVTRVAGELLARGGTNGGDGGRIETSGHWLSTEGVRGDAVAPKGKAGEWLFDPYDITISTNGNTVPSSGAWSSSATSSTVSSTSISSLLSGGTSVTVSTGAANSAGTDAGNITVSHEIRSTGSVAKLTLNAHHNIAVNNTISVGGSGSMVELNAGNTSTGGNVTLGGGVSADTLSVNITGAGALTQTAAVTANNLKLTGTNTDVTLDHSSNKVGVLAANVKSLSLVNDTGINANHRYGSGLYVGTVDGLSGINATGRVSITMNNGNIFLDKNIATTATDTSMTSPALMLNAGAEATRGAGGTFTAGSGINPYGFNIVRLGTATLAAGTGGRIMLYTGSVDGGSTELASYVGSGSKRFRYNNDEATLEASLNAGMTPLLSGVNLIFRQQPLLSVLSSTTQTYGLTATITPTFDGYANGDTLENSVNNPTGLTIGIGGDRSSAGFYTAGNHALTVSGATSQLGYGFNYLPSNLTVNKKGLTVTAVASNKVYDSLTAATTQLSTDKFDADVVGVTSTSSVFSDKNVASGKTVTVSGLALSSGRDAGNYIILNSGATATATAAITPLAITGNYTAQGKVYDGTTTAAVTGTSTGVLPGDTVTFVNAVATFTNKNANATATPVNMTSISLGGTDGGNYSVANPTASLSAVISPKPITATFTGTSKVYDGSSTASVTGSSEPFVGGDSPTYSGVVANFVNAAGVADKNAAIGKTIHISGFSLTGNGASNYSVLNTTARATADITPKAASMTGVTASDKIYDGTTTATLSGGTLTGVLSGDTVLLNTVGTFSDKNAGDGKNVSIAASYTGADAGNYNFSNQASTTANISKRSLAVTAEGVDKPYDGTNTATYTLKSNQVAGDVLTLRADTGSFRYKDVVGSQTVTVNGIAVTGTDANNYNLQNTSTTTTAQVLPKQLTASVSADSREYDGTTDATARLSGLTGFVGYETVTAGTVVASFNSKDVATANTVTVDSVQFLNGANGGIGTNYAIASGQTAAASITRKALTATATASSKEYDGTANATSQVTLNLSGLVTRAGATESLNYSKVASFNSKDVATANSVTVQSVTLQDGSRAGDLAGNYSIDASQIIPASATITPKSLSATANAANKVYDGTTQASDGVRLSLAGFVSRDGIQENLDYTQTSVFNSKDVVDANRVTVNSVILQNGSRSGDLASNYTLNPASIAQVTAHITPKALSAVATASDRDYDGTTNASNQVSLGLSGFVSRAGALENLDYLQTSSFNSKDVLTAHTVTVDSVTLRDGARAGDLASNYSLSASDIASVSARIRPVTLTATTTASNKTYDGTTNASPYVTLALQGLVARNGQTESLGYVQTSAFNSKNVADANQVQVTGVTLLDGVRAGDLASNYAISPAQIASANAQITRKSITPTYRALDKVYDNSLNAQVVAGASGFENADDVQLNNATASFTDKNAGIQKDVVVAGITLAGADANNYSLSTNTAATRANIAPQPLSVDVLAHDKWYDGTRAAEATLSNLRGFVGSETVTLSGNTASFNSANPQEANRVTVNALSLLDGANGGLARNYTIASEQTAPAKIRPQPTGCQGNCSPANMSSTPAPVPPLVAGAAAPSLVAGVSASAIKRSSPLLDGGLQLPAVPRAVTPPPAVSATPLAEALPALGVNDVRQVRGLSTEQVAALPAAKLAELMPVLTPRQLMAVTPKQMAELDASELNQLVNLMDNALSKMKAR